MIDTSYHFITTYCGRKKCEKKIEKEPFICGKQMHLKEYTRPFRQISCFIQCFLFHDLESSGSVLGSMVFIFTIMNLFEFSIEVSNQIPSKNVDNMTN